MMTSIADGVWPTMITPFTGANAPGGGNLDLAALEPLVGWYLDRGVNGLFAVCQSSEMFHLSLAERVRLARAVVEFVDGRVGVVASGQISDTLEAQVEEVSRIAETGVDAVVLVTNRFARSEEGDAAWIENVGRLLDRIPEEIPLGWYECPYPYKRLFSPETLRWSVDTGRFVFIKDTCCDLETIAARQAILQGTGLKLFNANAATLLASLHMGVAGYSSVMANFHPELYVWLCRNWQQAAEQAEELQAFLGVASLMGRQIYPVNAKYHLQLEGVPMTLQTRTRRADELLSDHKLQVEQLRVLSLDYARRLGMR
jgi:4-hydroxy-tetrahydrodipicolinate synthase